MNKVGTMVLAICLISLLEGCATIPKGATVVSNFEKAKYLGKWYELARYDFIFEKDLDNTSAEYSVLDNGLIGVINRGHNYKTGKWSEAKGVARFRGLETLGELEVSFFGPFFAPYNILSLDGDYEYALVAGSTTEYLWILARTKTIPSDIRQKYIEIAQKAGYEVEKLIWVNQGMKE